MDPLTRKVAARWAFGMALAPWTPSIPDWVFAWGARVVKTAYADRGFLHELQHGDTIPPPSAGPTPADIFQAARESVEILLPKFKELLRHKFREQFGMNASAMALSIYYYFVPRHPLENIAVSVSVHQSRVLVSMMYAPVNLHNVVDYKKVVEAKEMLEDPELAGMALMRLARKVLAQV
jgi:hypothetical protein